MTKLSEKNQAHTVRVAVYGILLKDDMVLMLRRYKTGWMDGMYGLPAGHLEKGETLAEATIREIHEEAGVEVSESDLEFKHVSHRNEAGNFEYMDFYYIVRKWNGEPRIAEKDKADDLRWFDLDDLPENIAPNVKMGILAVFGTKVLSEFDGRI